MQVRQARAGDEDALRRIDLRTWTSAVSPAGPRPADRPFFGRGTTPDQVLVAESGGAVVGYVTVAQGLELPSHQHVLEIAGLAVDPEQQRGGAGRRLVDAAVEHARAGGARKLTLRVLGPNAVARALYEACGFRVEGVLVEEFLLDGRYVDDVLMARFL